MTATPSFMGLQPTGRQMRDPAATLHELEDDDGRVYTAIAFDPRYHGHEALTLNVKLVESFMQYPMVAGLVELARHDLDAAVFAYPTGRVFTLADVLRTWRDIGRAPGVRAAVEMSYLAAQILIEAGDTGPMQGCFSHGNLNPCRVAVRLDGELQVFGYGIAHVDLMCHMKDPSTFPVAPESLRYAPPERIEGQPEGPAADTYSLTVAAFEMATGRPLYDSLDVDALKRSIALSEGTTLLSGRGHGLPDAVAKTFARALIYDPETRLSGAELVEELEILLERPDVEGDGLATIMEKMRGQQVPQAPRGRKLVSASSTELFTADALQRLADDDDAEEEEPREARWTRVTRRRGVDEADEPEVADAPDADTRPRRLRRRSDPQPAPEPPEPEPEPEPEENPRRRLRRRLEADAPDEDDGPRRRLRRRSDAHEPDADAPDGDSPRRRLRRRSDAHRDSDPEPVTAGRLRRRLRRRDDDDDPTDPGAER